MEEKQKQTPKKLYMYAEIDTYTKTIGQVHFALNDLAMTRKWKLIVDRGEKIGMDYTGIFIYRIGIIQADMIEYKNEIKILEPLEMQKLNQAKAWQEIEDLEKEEDKL